MYFPTTRVLTVLELLQSRQQIGGPELAARLEVDARTVRRYITMLQDLGVPVEAVRGRYGAYRLRPGFKLPPLMFTDEEALALTLGLLAARKMGLVGAAPAVEGAIAKIERVLPIALRERVQAIQDTLIFDLMPSRTPPASGILNVLSAAAQQRRCVWIHYQAYSGDVSERIFDTYGLVYRSGCWYAAGYCHLRQDIRVFRLDRMLQVELREEEFTKTPDFDSLAHVLRAISNTPQTWLVDVLLDMPLEAAQCMVSPTMATLEQEEGGVRFLCYADSLDWAAHQLVALRCPFVIRQPAELHDALRRLSARILALTECGEQ